MAQKVEIEDFSGGITDYYLQAPPNKVKQCDNLLINQYQDQGKVFTRPGSEVYDILWPQISTASRINTTFYYDKSLFVQSASKLFYYKYNANPVIDRWVQIPGYAKPDLSVNDAFPGATGNDQFTYAHWNYHTLIGKYHGNMMKVVKKEGGSMLLMQAGLPKFTSTGITIVKTGTTNTYLYKLAYKRNYTTGPGDSTTFIDVGKPCLPIEVKSNAIGPGNTVTLNNIPTLVNTSETNWEPSIKVQIYRTVNNGTVYFLVGEIANGVTSFVDDATDAEIETSEVLYTTGGVVDNDPPPPCRSIHIRNDIAYYGNVIESDGTNRFRLRQSVPGDIDSVPETFYVDVDDEIVQVSSTKNNVIILCTQNAYRVDGFFDELGRGGMTVERISDTAGCISNQCAVQALDGVIWLGKDAVYYTDGFRVIKLNQDYNKTYKTFTLNDSHNLKFQGKYDKVKNRIWWTIQGPDSSDLNKCYVLDLNWGVRDNATFTTISGDSFVPCAIEFINGDMIRCTQYGHILVHKDSLFVDPKVDPLVFASSWINETIIYTLETCSYNFGTSATRKYVTQANVTCESTTNLALQIVSNNDDNRVVANLLPIRYRGNIVWGEPDVYWGDHTLEWNRQGLIHEKRLMPAKSLRCNFKSLKFTNAKVAIVSSDVIGTASIDKVFKTVTLTNLSSYDWPSKAVGYYISFESDNYVNEYLIVQRTNDVLVYQDALNTSQSAPNQNWVIRGKPQGETLNLLNFSIVYDISGPSLNPFKTAGSGEVGT